MLVNVSTKHNTAVFVVGIHRKSKFFIGTVIGIMSHCCQPTLCIVGTGSTNGIYKNLVQVHDDWCVVGNSLRTVLQITFHARDFIHGLENQMLVIILKALGNNTPNLFKLIIYLIDFIGSNQQPAGLLRTVVMNVDDGVHVLGNTVIHNFLHTVQPVFVDGKATVDVTCNHVAPGNRNTHGVVARIMQRLHICFGSHGRLPSGFGWSETGMTIHGVTKIGTKTHFEHQFIAG